MAYRQLDILATRPDWFTIPRNVPGRLNAEDFVFFDYDGADIDISRYTVVVETLDVSSGSPFRSVSKLKETVEVPHVQLGQYAAILVIPDSMSLPAFGSTLIRGSTYKIPKTGGAPHWFQMIRHGVFRPNGI